MKELELLEHELDSFSEEKRKAAFLKLVNLFRSGDLDLPGGPFRMNLHLHTFFSFNALGYSPVHVVWRARKEGLGMVGSVDFDVLDAVEEMWWAGMESGIPVTSGLETRIFLPDFSTEIVSSPGEPGVAYYMGNGFTRLPEKGTQADETLTLLRDTAQARNRKVIDAINEIIKPMDLDVQRDVMPLSPSGCPLERHIILALILRAEAVFPGVAERVTFWSDTIALAPDTIEPLIDDRPNLADLLRMKLVKQGGVAYVEPGQGDFPRMGTVHALIEELGAIPSFGWLDGTSSGEKDPNRLIEFCQAHQVESFFMVPDRNWNLSDEEERKTKLAKFYQIVQLAQEQSMPIFVGTELNKYGQKFVDEFESPSLAPLAPYFFEGAWILWGHTVLEKSSGRGYGSDWARQNFQSRPEKNRFYASLGQSTPADRVSVQRLGELNTRQLLERAR